MTTGMQLLVDIGNTRIKWALALGDKWVRGEACAHGQDWASCFSRLWAESDQPNHIVVSNVGGGNAETELTKWCQGKWACTPLFVRAEALTCGIRNGYREPHTLGVDRWMSIIGARSVTPSAVVVVDCGTAVTVDFLDESNRFVGGVIMPGEDISRNSLSRETAGISRTSGEPLTALGVSTDECVHGGVHFSIIGGIERVINEMTRSLEYSPPVLITGGGAHRISPHLDTPVQYEPDLVLKGLAEVTS
jgi:type III pantothenate kinase